MAAELAGLRAEAEAVAEFLSGVAADMVGAGEPQGEVWRISDSSSVTFGELAPAAAVGIYPVSAIASFEEPKSVGPRPLMRRLHSGAGRDKRIMADAQDPNGRRHLNFLAAMSLLAEFGLSHWPVDSPKTVRDFLLALRRAGHTGLLEYHDDWGRNCSVSESSADGCVHKRLLDILRMLAEYDQVDPIGLAAIELLVR